MLLAWTKSLFVHDDDYGFADLIMMGKSDGAEGSDEASQIMAG